MKINPKKMKPRRWGRAFQEIHPANVYCSNAGLRYKKSPSPETGTGTQPERVRLVGVSGLIYLMRAPPVPYKERYRSGK